MQEIVGNPTSGHALPELTDSVCTAVIQSKNWRALQLHAMQPIRPLAMPDSDKQMVAWRGAAFQIFDERAAA